MEKTVVIAEAGVNHNGRLDLAKRLVEVAASAGADYVKFQSFKADKLVSKHAPKANYQRETTDPNESQLAMIKSLELTESAHHQLIEHCSKCKIGFLSSPFDIDGISYLDKLGVDLFKVPSGEITNLPYLRHLKRFDRPIFLSTGMAFLDEVEEALQVLSGKEVLVLHCNTEYPTPFSDVNLNAMVMMKKKFGVEVGYSDHTLGIEVPVAAVALGAKVIEKHFTLDRGMSGPDHRASLEPEELKTMVGSIRNIEKALGTGQKIPSESEKKNISIARKSIVAKCSIRKGEIFSERSLTTKRPGSGLSPMLWDQVIGRRANKDFLEDELIEL